MPELMLVPCACGATTSAFNPRCPACGRAVVEDGAPTSLRPSERRSALVVSVGRALGAYRVTGMLGAGTRARVYRAIRETDAREVALKVLHPHLLQDRDAQIRFLEEARALSRVEHPFIGRILDAFEFEGTPVLALELYRGESLRVLLDRRKRFRVDAVLPIVSGLVEALGALHEAGWVHRDVKPENVMILDPDALAPRDVRLLDFGLAKSLGMQSGTATAVGVFVGSPAYAAPEQFVSEVIGPAVDWWALGVMTYELCVGERPFLGSSRVELARNIFRAEIPLARLDPSIAPWILHLVSKDPNDRPAGWKDAMKGLREASRH